MNRLKPLLDILNRFSGWLLLLALGWLCWSAARLLWLVLAPPLAPALPVLPLQNLTGSVTDNSSLFAIFAEPDPVAQSVQPPPNVILKGVLLADPESSSSALLDVNGMVKNYRIGDSLQETGYTLVAVDWNAVVIADGAAKQSVISMADAMPLDQRGMATNAIGNQRLPDNNNNGLASGLPQPLDIPNLGNIDANNNSDANNSDVNNSNDTNSAIDKAVNELQENPAGYLSRMGVMASGEGYQVTAAMPSGLRNRLGLEPGDRVMSVNGQSVGNNPGQDANVLQQVQKSGEAQIEVKRGEQVITIRQQF
ncbi:type II secretion system protein N [Psychrobacter sp. M13]|uniref:type II secretion system protein N n=1 Tax=Psychrobacter sp. M13 TaxID=3067275 RepID=UPI00273CD0E6|nr:type II secretion system protein N [Psychrobacter sp. M13]WLP93967.1 type II secretion system protein N [Psychrobacter sp. M13]